MAYTKATMKAVDKYVKNNYDSFLVRVPKGRKATIEEQAKEKGESVNGMINRLLREDAGMTEEEWKDAVEAEMDKIIEENLEAFKALAKE